MNKLPTWLAASRVVVFVGDGGVGKTTCAAAAALAAARSGKRVCALTIDPAPRLAQTLGLDELCDTPSRIDLGTIEADPGGRLDALRLDTEATFDRLVRTLAPTAEQADTVLASPIYRAIAGRLGGSDAYMAFQRVYELDAEGDYDLLIVDTPPAAHAGELLGAPARLASLVDTGAAKILADPALAALRAGSKLAAAAIRAIIAAVSQLAGIELTKRVSQFATAFEDILAQLSRRADSVGDLLRGEDCRFVHVVTPERTRIREARDVTQSLADHGVEVTAQIINRVLPPAGPPPPPPSTAPAGTGEALDEIHRLLELERARQSNAVSELAELRSTSQRAIPCIVVHEKADLDGPGTSVTAVDRLAELSELISDAC